MFFRRVFLAIFVLSFLAAGARAQDYAAATWPNMLHTLIRFNAMELSEQTQLDEYVIVTDCELYKSFFKDDFKWNQVRQATKESIRINVATYPMNYYYDLKMQLGRYDFAAKLFRFTERSQLSNVNTFVLYSVVGTDCGDAEVKSLPRTFRAVLSSPLSLEGLPLNEKDAQDLLAQMDKDDNPIRIIYARYNLRTVYIEQMRKTTEQRNGAVIAQYKQSKETSANTVRLDVRLDSIGFYEDPQMTKLIYLYQP